MNYDWGQFDNPPESTFVPEDGCYSCGGVIKPDYDGEELVGYTCTECGAGMFPDGEPADLGGMNAVEDGLPYGHRL